MQCESCGKEMKTNRYRVCNDDCSTEYNRRRRAVKKIADQNAVAGRRRSAMRLVQRAWRARNKGALKTALDQQQRTVAAYK